MFLSAPEGPSTSLYALWQRQVRLHRGERDQGGDDDDGHATLVGRVGGFHEDGRSERGRQTRLQRIREGHDQILIKFWPNFDFRFLVVVAKITDWTWEHTRDRMQITSSRKCTYYVCLFILLFLRNEKRERPKQVLNRDKIFSYEMIGLNEKMLKRKKQKSKTLIIFSNFWNRIETNCTPAQCLSMSKNQFSIKIIYLKCYSVIVSFAFKSTLSLFLYFKINICFELRVKQ